MKTSSIILAGGALAAGAWIWSRRSTDEPSIVAVPLGTESDGSPIGLSIGWARPEVEIAPIRAVFEPSEWIESSPKLGRFVALDRKVTIEKIAREMVRQVAMQAGERRKLDRSEVKQWADDMARDGALVRAAEDLLHASGWNDETAGSPQAERKGPHGRGIDPRGVHDDQGAILARGGTPRRNLDASGRVVSPSRRARPLVWVPALNPDTFGAVILDGLKGEPVTSQGMEWDDGSAASWPPPVVTSRGVIHGKD